MNPSAGVRGGLFAALVLVAAASGATDLGLKALPRGDAATPTIAARARLAGDACKADDLLDAVHQLRALHKVVAARVGSENSATQIVALSLSQAERALGIESPRESTSSDGGQTSLDDESAAALRHLRSCTRARPSVPNQPPALPGEMTLDEGGFETHLQAARVLANKGHYKAAALSAERAHTLARLEEDAGRRLVASRAVALLRLQVGDFDGAASSASEADDLARNLADHETRIAMARLFGQVRYLDRAGQVLAEVSAAAGNDPLVRAELDEAGGDLALKLGAPGRAIELLTRAIAGHRENFGVRDPSTAAVIGLRGDAHRMAGDIPTALVDLREALSIRVEVFGTSHPEVARTRNAIGVLMADLGDWAEANHEFSIAHESLTNELGKHHPEVVTVRANRVLVEWGREQSNAYAFHYAAVLDALTIAYGEDHPVVSEARRNLARMQEQLGDTEAAESLLDKAILSQQRALGEDHPALAQTLIAQGKFFARQGRLADAKRQLDRAIDLLGGHYGDEHPLVARARSSRARVATALGQDIAAWEDATEAARVFELHLQRSFGAMPDRQRVLLAADSADVVGALLSANLETVRDAYVAIIPQRDSVLRSIAATRARERDRPDRESESLLELQQLRARYVAAVLSASEDAGERSRELARAIDAQQSVVSLARGDLRELDPAEVLHRACRNLPDDAALVDFVEYDRVKAGKGVDPIASYLAFVVRPRSGTGAVRECSVERVELGPANEIDGVADRFAIAMHEQRNDAPTERKELSRMLLEPLRRTLKGSSRWLVVPDGSLWGVPFAALPDPLASERYLVERVTTGNLTSIHELADYRASESPGDIAGMRGLLFGAPDFGAAPSGQGPLVMTATGPCRLSAFEPLPATVRELEEIKTLLPDARIVLGSEATKRRLFSELNRHPSIVHLATHAYFAGAGGCDALEPQAPVSDLARGFAVDPNPLLLSGIVFAGANDEQGLRSGTRGDESSGILTALEAAGLDLGSARLVVLSACDTGTGLHNRGQEVQGLRWGFRAAGAKSLVTSLWLSNDVVTRKMMREFYQSLVGNTHGGDLFRGAESLRAAQLARVKSEQRLGLRKPGTWSTFVFSGLY